MKIWRSKKLLVSAVLAAALVVGSIGGAVLAADNGDTDNSQPRTLLARVAEILDVDQQELEDAFAQAREEMWVEAQDLYLQKLVDEGRITTQQAEELKAWWDARPDDISFLRPFGHIRNRSFGCTMERGESLLARFIPFRQPRRWR